MSHFTVCVRVPDSLVVETLSIDAAVTAMLAPYQENNMGDCPEKFLAFKDVTEEHEQSYKTDTASKVRLLSGEVASAFDDRFKNPARSLFGNEPQYVYPDGAVEFEQPICDAFTFDEYVTDYCGYKKDDKTGRYGYWENPNKKWDWWTIGGRWTGFFPVRPGTKLSGRLGKPGSFDNAPETGRADVVRVSEIDFDLIATETNAAANKFWEQWQRLIAGEKFQPFDGPREKAMSIGLLDVKRESLSPDEQTRALPWTNFVPPSDDRASWHDVFKVVTHEEFMRDYLMAFSPIATYCTLDENGWREPGRMGWFGMSSDTPETYMAAKNGFLGWLRETPADAWVVVVDCHI